MKYLFWIALTLESAALFWFLSRIWKVSQRPPEEVEWAMYRKELYPALVLGAIVLGALLARFVFNSPKIASYIAFSPAIMLVLSMVGMMFASMLTGGKWQ